MLPIIVLLSKLEKFLLVLAKSRFNLTQCGMDSTKNFHLSSFIGPCVIEVALPLTGYFSSIREVFLSPISERLKLANFVNIAADFVFLIYSIVVHICWHLQILVLSLFRISKVVITRKLYVLWTSIRIAYLVNGRTAMRNMCDCSYFMVGGANA